MSRGEGLTRRLLSVARREEPEARQQRLELAEWLPAQADTLRAALRNRAVLVLEVPGDLWPVRIDPDELEAALINLAANARDALQAAGRASGRFTLSARNAEGGMVEVSAADDGPGMPEAVAARALEPFFTTKPAPQGTGLGLAQVAACAQGGGGTVRIASAPEQGTAVILCLPRAQPEAG